jgi:acetyl-CoA carboxylase carboxyltransferase component
LWEWLAATISFSCRGRYDKWINFWKENKMAFDKELKELEQRCAKALQMGGAEKIKEQHDKGKMSARDRIDQLLDPGSLLHEYPRLVDGSQNLYSFTM